MNNLGPFVHQEPHHDRLYCELLDILLKELTLNGRRNISDEVYAELQKEIVSRSEIYRLQPKFDQAEFAEMVRRGTKAWADVPDSAVWVDNLRGNDE